MSFLITSVLNCTSDRLAISLLLSCIFFWSFDLFFHLGHVFCLSWCACCIKGWSLRCSPGRGNGHCCTVMLYVGKGSNREQWCLLHSLPAFSHFSRFPQSNWAPLVLIPRWVDLCISRPLWVSPTNSPVRLGVSPSAASAPTGVFNQWFEALFPHAGTVGCAVYGWVHQLLPCCQLQLCPPCSTIRHLAGSASHCLAESPLCPAAHLHPSYRSR